MCATVHLSVLDSRLRRALLERLSRVEGVAVAEAGSSPVSPVPGDDGRRIVIVLATETKASDCEALCQDGADVIVLAPITRAADEARYLKAGAAEYLAMDVHAETLEAAIRRLDRSGRTADDRDA